MREGERKSETGRLREGVREGLYERECEREAMKEERTCFFYSLQPSHRQILGYQV